MYSWLRHAGSILWKRQPIQLTFFVTRKCNARCPFCFYLQSTAAVEPDANELSLEEIRKLSRSLGPLLWLAFSGGEIFLRKDLVEISRVFYRQNRPAIMLYPTNGLLPELIYERTAQILRDCGNSIVVVKLSLDGVHGAHDALRRTPGGFDKVMQTYQRLAELLDEHANFELGINTVFCSENQDQMDEIIEFVQGLEHVRTHTISLVRGQLTDARYQEVDHAKYERAIGKLAANLRNRTTPTYRFRGARLKAAQDILQRQLIHRTLLEQRRLTPCYAGRLNLVLTESGEVYPCELLAESLGNVREYDYDLRKILRSEKAGTAVRAIRDQRCYCTHECYYITNILFNPGMYPALAREYLRL
ncbi:MAG TPA: radical SAM protein [Acidiferrobacterales bacterium]|nr:radical SAM protein [Acidiferrobacterales bacterium]